MKAENIFLRIAGFIVSCIILSYSSVLAPLKFNKKVLAHTQTDSNKSSLIAVDNDDYQKVELEQEKPLIQAPKQAINFRINMYYSNLNYNGLKTSAQNSTVDSTDKKLHHKTVLGIAVSAEDSISDRITTSETSIPNDIAVAKPVILGTKSLADSNLSIYPTGKVEYSQFEFKIYPNPADIFCKIEISDDWTDKELVYRICDLQGKYIEGGRIVGNVTEINTCTYSNGVYLINIQSKKVKVNSTEKILVKR